jgi:parallel beta-helix repeat protein
MGLVLCWLAAGFVDAQTDCTNLTLQSLIDKAAAGSTLTLPDRTCTVNLIVNKSLVLRGAGARRTFLKGAQPGKPVLYIESAQRIDVVVENLGLADAPKLSSERDCAIFYPELICPSGIEVRGNARTVLRQARVAGNAWVGVYVLDSSRALIQVTEIANNGWGVYLSGEAQVTIEDSSVLNNKQVGIEAWASVTVKDSRVSGNVDGIKLVQDRAEISGNHIRENLNHGILITGSASAEIQQNEVEKNGGWGITAWLRDCGFSNNSFTGQASVAENKVQENKLGQVCLP